MKTLKGGGGTILNPKKVRPLLISTPGSATAVCYTNRHPLQNLPPTTDTPSIIPAYGPGAMVHVFESLMNIKSICTNVLYHYIYHQRLTTIRTVTSFIPATYLGDIIKRINHHQNL